MILYKTLYEILCLRKQPMLRRLTSVALFVIVTGASSTVVAESSDKSSSDYKNRPLDVRVDRLERLMSSQKQLELLYRMQQLQKENQQLRSLLEEQSNEIHQLKQQQRELYADLNRRLNQMEGLRNTQDSVATSPSGEVNVPQGKPALPEVVDKSTVKPSLYGVTQREEVLVDGASEAEVSKKDATQGDRTAKPPVATIKPMSEKERKAEQKAYQKAYDELTARQYNKARESFMAFIQAYPSGRYAHIAQYWVAESSYALRNYDQAVRDYQLLLDVYPFSPKKAEAELKKAYSYYELGDKKNARRTLDQLLINYPDTTEAGQAKRLLKKL